jgi:hypothetical protein
VRTHALLGHPRGILRRQCYFYCRGDVHPWVEVGGKCAEHSLMFEPTFKCLALAVLS